MLLNQTDIQSSVLNREADQFELKSAHVLQWTMAAVFSFNAETNDASASIVNQPISFVKHPTLIHL